MQQPNTIKAIIAPYIRMYFDRGSGLAVVDQGPNTQAIRYDFIRFNGTFNTEYAAKQDDTVRPRFWFSARNVVLFLHDNGQTLEISTVVVPVCQVKQVKPTVTDAQTQPVG
jgi:hypothetical protein